MKPEEFIRKWEQSTLKESASAQQHFLDLCALLDEPTPAEVDPTGDRFCFEKGATKSTGGQGFADVWKKGAFGWEYKGPSKDLDRAYNQLLRYSVALESPPLLIVSDTKTIIIRTNWTNTVQEKHEIALADLVDASKRDILKAAFSNPNTLKPKKTRQQLTAQAADDFSELAQRLRERGHDPHKVAHFVNRLVFCMFAEDVRLLPNKLFEKALRRSEQAPEKAQGYLQRLFAAMKDGGEFGLEEIPWFNGGLFNDDEALPLDHEDVRMTLKAAKLDWSDIDPSILGTLFERGLDPSKRSQLGAHYTDRDKIMMILNPVIIEPLTAQWKAVRTKLSKHADTMHKAEDKISAVQAEATTQMKKGAAKSGEAARQKLIKAEKARATKALNAGQKLFENFLESLRAFRVLDPACGSGNFLYLSLLALKDLEHKANLDAEALGFKRLPPRIGPEAVKGIEINPYAAELARVSIWIGEIQWMRRNGFDAGRNPILRRLGNIECRDALIEQEPETSEWRETEWPDADVIVGNPPFLGSRKMQPELGNEYVKAARNIFKDRVHNGADLVCFWFARSFDKLNEQKCERFGLVATNSISGGASREILKPIFQNYFPIAVYRDEPWTVDGASVRVALIVVSKNPIEENPTLDGAEVSGIYPDLNSHEQSTNVDLTKAERLSRNQKIAFQGVVPRSSLNKKDAKKLGLPDADFAVSGSDARSILSAPRNPNGMTNREVIVPYIIAIDVVRRPMDRFIIDFGLMSEIDAALFELPFGHIQPVKIHRKNMSQDEAYKTWWQHWRSRPEMRSKLAPLSRFIVTPRVAKYRLFSWAKKPTLPDNAVVAFARDDDASFGILHSKFHEIWSLRMCTWLGVGNDPRYTPTTCFETFPFPNGLTPDILAAEYENDPRATRIVEAAVRLNELRENWVNPPDLVKRIPEVVEGFPDRILPVDEEAEKILKKRTLTNLYNERPAWLDNAHRTLDEAVAAAYGWEEDFKADKLTDEEILKRLFELNQQRAAAQEKKK
jgi:type II restriction/modification system DNA methylase subunit YeeA